MDDEIKNKLIGSIDKVAGWIEEFEGFAREQVPEIVKEILMWGLYSNLVYAIGCIAIFIISIYCFRSILNSKKPSGPDEEFIHGFLFLITIISFILSMVVFVSKLLIVIKILVAPRLYLLEQLNLFQ
jgi:hypothetical protein